MRSIPLGWALLACAAAAQAQSAPDARTQMNTQALAATCANCHGTQGRALPGAPVAGLAGRPADELATLLRDFKSGKRPSTVMQQLAKGFNDTQIDQLAAYFAAQPPERRAAASPAAPSWRVVAVRRDRVLSSN